MLNFLRDLLTPAELRENANRWAAARMLHDGHTVREVAATLSMATATVNRTRTWLLSGTGGFLHAIESSSP
jgi:uncharacterized protein YerC